MRPGGHSRFPTRPAQTGQAASVRVEGGRISGSRHGPSVPVSPSDQVGSEQGACRPAAGRGPADATIKRLAGPTGPTVGWSADGCCPDRPGHWSPLRRTDRRRRAWTSVAGGRIQRHREAGRSPTRASPPHHRHLAPGPGAAAALQSVTTGFHESRKSEENDRMNRVLATSNKDL